jgi:hypothetical protein
LELEIRIAVAFECDEGAFEGALGSDRQYTELEKKIVVIERGTLSFTCRQKNRAS